MKPRTPGQMAAELVKAGAAAEAAGQAVVFKGSMIIKATARATVARVHTDPGKLKAGSFINFDVSGLDSEIGYDKTGAGNLGNFNEYGSAGNTPDNALSSALAKEAPVITAYLAKLVGQSWR